MAAPKRLGARGRPDAGGRGARRAGPRAPGRHGRAQFLLVPDLIRHSDLIALLPALSVADDGVATFDLPIALDDFTLHLTWHRRREQDHAVQYVTGEIRRLLAAA